MNYTAIHSCDYMYERNMVKFITEKRRAYWTNYLRFYCFIVW
jgi:hypothetical protein